MVSARHQGVILDEVQDRYGTSLRTAQRMMRALNLALEGMKEALRQSKATPADSAKYAIEAGSWKIIQPYLEAMLI